jgi:hypothetical protein
MGYNLIDADFTPKSQLANVNLMDPNLQDPMGGGVGGTPAGGYSFGGMTPGVPTDANPGGGGGERPWWLENMGGGMRPKPKAGGNHWAGILGGVGGILAGGHGTPGSPTFDLETKPVGSPQPLVNWPMPYTRPKRPNLAYGNAYNQWEGGDQPL